MLGVGARTVVDNVSKSDIMSVLRAVTRSLELGSDLQKKQKELDFYMEYWSI